MKHGNIGENPLYREVLTGKSSNIIELNGGFSSTPCLTRGYTLNELTFGKVAGHGGPSFPDCDN